MNWTEFAVNLAVFIIGWFLPRPKWPPGQQPPNPFFPPQRRWNDPGNPANKKDEQQ